MELDIIEREAVRALLLTPQREILLLRIQLPDLDERERDYAVETERFAPRVSIVARYLRDGAPIGELEPEVLVD